MNTPEPDLTDQLTGVDRCPTCDTVVTFERHLDAHDRVVCDACSTPLVAPHTEEHHLQARAVLDAPTAHTHQLLDAHGRPPTVSGHPGSFTVHAELPVSCADCDATSEDLIAELDDSTHDTTVADGWLTVYPVDPILPAHLDPGTPT